MNHLRHSVPVGVHQPVTIRVGRGRMPTPCVCAVLLWCDVRGAAQHESLSLSHSLTLFTLSLSRSQSWGCPARVTLTLSLFHSLTLMHEAAQRESLSLSH